MSAGNQRLIDAPQQEHLTRQEVAHYLRMEVKTLTRLIESGEFPRPYQLSPGTWIWHWSEVAAYAMMSRVKGRCKASRKKDTPQPTPNRPPLVDKSR